MTEDLFYQMCKKDVNDCLIWQGETNKDGNPRYYSVTTNEFGGYMRSWVWKKLMKRARKYQARMSAQCGTKLCLSPEHLERQTDFCSNRHSLKKGSPHRAIYPGSGEIYCRTCKMDSFRKRAYGITTAQRDEILLAQDNACRICKAALTGRIYIDHNHKTGQIRGILCRICNTGLGMFKDDENAMANALKYLADDGQWVRDLFAEFSLGGANDTAGEN